MPEPRPDLPRTIIVVLFIALLIVAPIWILKPFLRAIVWATLLAVITWPLMRWLEAKLWGKRSLAITVLTSGLLAIIVVPFAAMVIAVRHNLARIEAFVADAPHYNIPPAPAWLGNLPLVGGKAAAMWTSAAADGMPALLSKAEPHLRAVAAWLGAEVISLGRFLVEFLLTVAIQAVMLARGERAMASVKAFARRVSGKYGEQVVDLATSTVQSVALGVVVTGVVQALFGGIGLAIARVPLAPVLTVAMCVLCVSQLSPLPILVGAVIWAFHAHGVGWTTFLVVWTVATELINYLLQPVLLGKSVRLPVLVTLAGVIGGLLAFGLIGLFLGPVALAMTYTFLKAWVRGDANGSAAETSAHPR